MSTVAILDTLFGPIRSVNYCWFFEALSWIGLFLLVTAVLGVVTVLYFMVKMGTGNRSKSVLSSFPMVIMSSGIIAYGMLYFTNRLLYQMCKTQSSKEGMGSRTYEEHKKLAKKNLQTGTKKIKNTMDKQQASRPGRPQG